MRHMAAIILVLLCAISIVPLRQAHAAQKPLPEDMVVRVEQQWLQAFHDKDRDTLNKLMADDFMASTPIGEILGKAKLVPPDHSVQALPKYKLVATVTHIYGDVAVLMGRLLGENGEQLSTTSVFKRKDDSWIIIAAQLTPLPK
jgi:ketosteroid isomerase-like protein